jgi:phytanoyl-CoA hydroxylase
MTFVPEQFDEKEYFREDTPENEALIATKISHPLKKGDVVLFHCKLLHRANKNRTDEPKISFVYTVKGCSNRAVSGTRSTAYEEIPLQTEESE